MEPDQRPGLANVWPLIATVLMASGIFVRTMPLESKRPSNPDRIKLSRASHQDVEARLWQDPFTVMHQVKRLEPHERCKEAIEDWAHHPSMLGQVISHKSKRHQVIVLPVMIPGGPYFEDSEARRRSRYAVVMALLRLGLRPSDEDHIGYVWTFDSCVVKSWERQVPELLPYEWFVPPPQLENSEKPGVRSPILVLWVDEDVITRQPVRGIERIIEILIPDLRKEDKDHDLLCPSPQDLEAFKNLIKSVSPYGDDEEDALKKKLKKKCELKKIRRQQTIARSRNDTPDAEQSEDSEENKPDIRVIGPSTSSSLIGLVRDLARDLVQRPAKSQRPEFHFYSSGATIPRSALDLPRILQNVLSNYLSHYYRKFKPDTEADYASVNHVSLAKDLEKSFHDRVVRLTTEDDKLVEALGNELEQRLSDATPWSFLSRFVTPGSTSLCDDTVVVISEGDTRYAQAFRTSFEKYFSNNRVEKDNKFRNCPNGSIHVHHVQYLQGLDGVLPTETRPPQPSASPPSDKARTNMDIVFNQASLERAEGLSQYDYLRRLGAYLMNLDRGEKRAGRNGVRAVGVLGSDTYDKILVLDALRDRFPKAIFFTADLDARLLGREVIRSTRNMIVASSYGLTLNPGIQGAAPPFRNTYQTGMYLSTLVALTSAAPEKPPKDFSRWFTEPQLFEIGRTRAVPLSKGSGKECKQPDPEDCKNIHALDEWTGFNLWPTPALVMTLAIIVVTLAIIVVTDAFGLFPLYRHAYRAVCNVVVKIVAAMLPVVIVVCGIIWFDMTSGTGEPFAWFEGVSIWPTQLLELQILVMTFVLLFYGYWQRTKNIDAVANDFHLTSLSTRTSATMQQVQGARGFWRRPKWRWGLDRLAVDSPVIGTTADPWLDFLDQMQFRPTLARVLKMTALFFIFGVALLSLEWPLSPHRGTVSAWCNHTLLLLLLACMMALLCAAIDASERTRRYFKHLGPGSRSMPGWEEPTTQEGWTQYPVDADTIRLWTRFHFAVRLASSVNQFIYLPLIILLLVLPTHSRVFDAWDIPLPYVALLGISLVLAMHGAFSLRRAAADLKTQTLKHFTSQVEKLELIQYSRSSNIDATRAPDADPERRDEPVRGAVSAARADVLSAGPDHEDTPAPDDISPQIKANWLRRIAKEIRSEQAGPFRPLTQEPIVRAILIASGWVGGLSTLEFLFLK